MADRRMLANDEADFSAGIGTGGRVKRAARRPTRGRLRDAATICDAVLDVPGWPMRCELDAGHLAQGVKHKHGCTRWGHPEVPDAG